MRTIFLLLFFVATSTASEFIFKWENYKPVKMTRKLPDKSSEERKWEPIRYRVLYDDSVFDDIPVSQTKLLQKNFKRALKFFDVKVQREEEFSIYKSLNVNTSKYENMCDEQILSSKYDFFECAEGTEEKGCDDEGHETLKDVDYVWFVKVEDNNQRIAGAGACNYVPGTNYKPNVGMILFGKKFLMEKEERITREGEENLYNILRHEVSHALFFHGELWKAFPDGQNLYKKTTRSIVYPETLGSGMNETFYGIAFPKALEEARKYLDCPDLQYIEIENTGGQGTAGSHYDADFLPYETMRGDDPPFRIAYSRITLALMEDSGWYKVDYSYV
ncbi:unnamed protein product [Caenorhabditis auriculariae]|uniref:Leishmanolysin-like peptidase n=1 Tax=Caenorhabditis auriculariae TaxID=2777116 RepID=A0A8S1HHL3_9PELO|nr:unnamed protein product [Caenorhabditis auriculariae]